MRFAVIMVCFVWPHAGLAQDRFGDFVTTQLGFAPYFTQSVGWDMPVQPVLALDPSATKAGDIPAVTAPETTAWLVGMRAQERDSHLVGMALVWSDFPYDQAVVLGTLTAPFGAAAFMTQDAVPAAPILPDILSALLGADTPGPVLADLSGQASFPLGDFGRDRDCLVVTALYQNNQELAALVIVIGANQSEDAPNANCAPLIS